MQNYCCRSLVCWEVLIPDYNGSEPQKYGENYCDQEESAMSPLQALDGAFNQENREKCKAATGPLIEAVDNLTAFASNPEFASIPAQISPEVCPHLNKFSLK